MSVNATALALAFLMASTAAAHEKAGYDGNDTGGPLDITSTNFLHVKGRPAYDHCQRGKCLYFAARMQRDWASRILKKKGYVNFDIDTRGARAADYIIGISYRDGRLRGRLYNLRRPKHARQRVKAYRRDKWIITTAKLRQVDPIRGVLRWRAHSYYGSRRVCSRTCFDDTRTFKHSKPTYE